MQAQLLLVAAALTCLSQVWTAPEADLVTDLPGLNFTPNFKHYSGYLNGVGTKRLHYWFTESESSPYTAPLVLWLNGGPGCSSLLGLLTENGPFRINKDAATVVSNPFAWNRIANVIFLESPAGVGFSYDTAKNYTSNDDDTALNNFLALQDFFKKFPKFKGHDLYITGESYGGIYVPTLAKLVLEDPEIFLKGFAVGNGLSDTKMNDNSLVYFTYYHGLIGESEWNTLLKDCCPSNTTVSCDFIGSKSPLCILRLAAIQQLVWNSGLNVYNLYQECWGGVKDLTLRWDATRGSLVSSNFGYPFMSLKDTETSRLREKMLALPRGRVNQEPPCNNDHQVTAYLNKPEVKQALHVSESPLEWDLCSNVLNYSEQYDTMRPQYQEAIRKKLRILVYNGDVDMACNFLGDEWFVDSLHDEKPAMRKPWYYTAPDGTRQIAGYLKAFEHVTFVTIKGSGHMVPTDKPSPAFEMFVNFIKNKNFDVDA